MIGQRAPHPEPKLRDVGLVVFREVATHDTAGLATIQAGATKAEWKLYKQFLDTVSGTLDFIPGSVFI